MGFKIHAAVKYHKVSGDPCDCWGIGNYEVKGLPQGITTRAHTEYREGHKSPNEDLVL